MDSKIQAGEAFVQKYPDHPLVRLLENPEYRAALEGKLRAVVEEARGKNQAIEAAWETKHGEPFPRELIAIWRGGIRAGYLPAALESEDTQFVFAAIEGHSQKYKNLTDADRAEPAAAVAVSNKPNGHNEARDKWLYDECCKGTAYESILRRLGKKPKQWERLDSIQGVRSAVERYVERHKLPKPPKRQRGRKPHS